jgi:hypothetical protein
LRYGLNYLNIIKTSLDFKGLIYSVCFELISIVIRICFLNFEVLVIISTSYVVQIISNHLALILQSLLS